MQLWNHTHCHIWRLFFSKPKQNNMIFPWKHGKEGRMRIKKQNLKSIKKNPGLKNTCNEHKECLWCVYKGILLIRRAIWGLCWCNFLPTYGCLGMYIYIYVTCIHLISISHMKLCNMSVMSTRGRRSSGTALRRGERLATTLGGWLRFRKRENNIPILSDIYIYIIIYIYDKIIIRY